MYSSNKKNYITALKTNNYNNPTQLISVLDSKSINISEIKPSIFADIIYTRSRDELYNNTDVANALNTFAQNWTKVIAHKVNEFDKKELVDSIWALGHISAQLDSEFIFEWIARSEDLLNSFTARDLTVSLLAISKINSDDLIPTVKDWTALEQKYITLQNQYSESTEGMITGHSILNISVIDKFLYNWLSAIKTIHGCSAKDLCQNIYAFQKLNFKPSDQFIESWQSKAQKDISNFNSQALANSIYAFEKLDIELPNFLIDTNHDDYDVSIIGDIQ